MNLHPGSGRLNEVKDAYETQRRERGRYPTRMRRCVSLRSLTL